MLIEAKPKQRRRMAKKSENSRGRHLHINYKFNQWYIKEKPQTGAENFRRGHQSNSSS
jgi:hypothetical protein